MCCGCQFLGWFGRGYRTYAVYSGYQFGNQSTSDAVSLIVSSDRELRGQLGQKMEDLQTRFRFLQGLMRDSVLILEKLQSIDSADSTVPNLLQQLSLEIYQYSGSADRRKYIHYRQTCGS